MPPIVLGPEEKEKTDLLLTRLLRLYVRALAVGAYLFGLYAWLILFDWFESPTMTFSQLTPLMRAQVVFFAFGSLVVASGLILNMAWGLVAWLISDITLILIGFTSETPFGNSTLVANICLLLLVVYGVLVFCEEVAQRRYLRQEARKDSGWAHKNASPEPEGSSGE